MQKGVRKLNSQSIYEEVKKEIIFLSLKPGEEINILSLAESLSVSRSPVRDALMRLQDEGLVDMLPQRGCWVSLIDYSKVREELLLRKSLELMTLDSLEKNYHLSYLKEMEFCIELQKEAKAQGDAVSYYEADDKMHEVYFNAAGFSRFWEIILRECGNYRRMRMLSFYAEGIARLNIEQHQELLDSLRDKKWNSTKKILISHIGKLELEKDKIIKKYPEYFMEDK